MNFLNKWRKTWSFSFITNVQHQHIWRKKLSPPLFRPRLLSFSSLLISFESLLPLPLFFLSSSHVFCFACFLLPSLPLLSPCLLSTFFLSIPSFPRLTSSPLSSSPCQLLHHAPSLPPRDRRPAVIGRTPAGCHGDLPSNRDARDARFVPVCTCSTCCLSVVVVVVVCLHVSPSSGIPGMPGKDGRDGEKGEKGRSGIRHTCWSEFLSFRDAILIHPKTVWTQTKLSCCRLYGNNQECWICTMCPKCFSFTGTS